VHEQDAIFLTHTNTSSYAKIRRLSKRMTDGKVDYL